MKKYKRKNQTDQNEGMRLSCFAYDDKGCVALNVNICAHGKECPFYKTASRLKAERAECRKRLR